MNKITSVTLWRQCIDYHFILFIILAFQPNFADQKVVGNTRNKNFYPPDAVRDSKSFVTRLLMTSTFSWQNHWMKNHWKNFENRLLNTGWLLTTVPLNTSSTVFFWIHANETGCMRSWHVNWDLFRSYSLRYERLILYIPAMKLATTFSFSAHSKLMLNDSRAVR